MKKINYLFLAFLMLSFMKVNAQDFALGVRGGLSIPNLSAGGSQQNPLNTGYSSRQGPDFGLFAEYKFSSLFSIQPMVEYSSQGGKKDGLQAFATPRIPTNSASMPLPDYIYANYNSEAKLNYLAIPILAKFGWTFKHTPLRLYVDAGPFVSFLLSAKQVTSGTSPFYLDAGGKQPLPGGSQSFNANTDIKDQLHTTDFGFEGNLGLAYIFGNSNIFIEGGGNYGLLNIQKGTANGKNNTGAATITAGYAYWFGK
jgi:hypothetical protein